jgi:hypothetical protein
MNLSPDLRAFVELLNAQNVKYVIVGGYAVAYHGHPRFTGDIDFFIEQSNDNASRVAAVINEFGFGSTGLTSSDFLDPGAIIQLGYPPHRIDLITAIDGVTFEEAWNDRVSAMFQNLPVQVISKALLVRNKSASGRPKDLGDISNL